MDRFEEIASLFGKSSLFINLEGRKQKLEVILAERDYDGSILNFDWNDDPLALAQSIVRFLFNKGDFFGTGVLLEKAKEAELDPDIKKALQCDWERYRNYLYH